MSNQATKATPAPSLRERAAQARDAAGRFIKRGPPASTHAEHVAEAALTGDVLAASGIDHRDGTVSYADATGKVVRHPMARWIAFNAVQMYSHVQSEMGRRRVIEANPLPGAEHAAWEARIRRELRVDAIAALTFIPGHAFQVEQDRRTGAEPMADGSILALIEEHRAAYAEWDRLSEVWSEMLTTDPSYAEAVAASEGPGRREIAAYEALFAARPTTLSGAIALTEYLREATERVSTNVQPSDAERALSIIASALRGIVATREERARQKTGLVDMLALTSATMDGLQTLGELAERVGGIAYSMAWRPCCHLGEDRYGVPEYNDAGKLALWLGNALTEVEAAVDREVARRAPVDHDERETRLSMRARPVINNGDPDQMEAFARELLDHAAAGRKGH